MTVMNMSDVRRANLRKVIDLAIAQGVAKNDADYCAKNDLSASYISQMLNAHRPIGEKSARKTESKIGLESHWLDQISSDLIIESATNETPTSTTSHVMGAIKVPVLNKRQIIELFNCKTGFKSPNDISSINIIEWLYTDMDVTEKAFVFDIEDESMSPDYVIGHKILVEPEIEPVPADDVCAYIEGEGLVFRRYKKLNARGDFELQSLNPLFASYLSTDTEIVIVGVMLVHWRYRKPR